MSEPYGAEVPHVGTAIAGHRIALGVQLRHVIEAAGPGTDTQIKFVEAAKRPSPDMIERHHAALMAAYTAHGTTADVQVPRREQWWVTPEDVALWHGALIDYPSVRWWWGIRREQGGQGGYCYCCSEMIRTFDVGRGVTAPVRRAVMDHRYQHIVNLRKSVGTSSKGIES